MNEYEKRINELEEELKSLKKAIINDNLFDVKDGETAYYNDLGYDWEADDFWKETNLNIYIPCKDKSIVEARQRRHKLSDLLERFAHEKDAVVTDKMWENKGVFKWYIYYNNVNGKYEVTCLYFSQVLSTIYFTSKEVAEKAIKEVVEPFMRGEI